MSQQGKIMLRKFFKAPAAIRLGRWALSSDPSIINRKVEMANMDHCGTCPTMKKKLHSAFDNTMDISLCALQSMHSYPTRYALHISEYKHSKTL